MKSMYERLCFTYEAGSVERFHTRPGLRACTDAKHSHGVAMLCFFLSDGLPSVNLLMEALTHDLGELYTGDVPAPTKWAVGSGTFELLEDSTRDKYDLRFPLTEQERRTLHLADYMEGVLWCADELSMGNKKAKLPGEKWLRLIETDYVLSFTEKEREVFDAVASIWRECNGQEGCVRFDVYR